MKLYTFLLTLILVFSICYPVCSIESVEIGTRLEPFFDACLIDQIDGVTHRLHSPQSAGVAMKFDRPWEGRYVGYITVIQEKNLFRMYYRGLPQSKSDGSNVETTCYAMSQDGIHWEKPDLGIYEYNNSTKTNIILKEQAPFSHNFAPFVDTNPNVTDEERYKALAGTSKSGLVGFISSDGIHWKKFREEPLITEGAFDSQNVSFWSESEEMYVCYLRTWTRGEYKGYRTISRSTSPDFIHWSKPIEMEFGAPLQEHLYTNPNTPLFSRTSYLHIISGAIHAWSTDLERGKI
jgi:hypothetical protein